jgi:molybdopterin synthase sulfur carrier subunit
MQLDIKYFGIISEVTGLNDEPMEFNGSTINELLELLYKKYPNLKNKDFQVAQNREITSFETKISSGEIALLPPFSGG